MSAVWTQAVSSLAGNFPFLDSGSLLVVEGEEPGLRWTHLNTVAVREHSAHETYNEIKCQMICSLKGSVYARMYIPRGLAVGPHAKNGDRFHSCGAHQRIKVASQILNPSRLSQKHQKH